MVGIVDLMGVCSRGGPVSIVIVGTVCKVSYLIW